MQQDPRTVFEQHYLDEITVRSFAHFSRLDPEARQEAIQDSLCQTWLNFKSAIARGKKTIGCPSHRRPESRKARAGFVTPATLARYVNRSYDAGRRFAGSSHTDVLADATRTSGRVHVVSLDDAPPYPDGLDDCTLHEVLADRRMENRPARLAQMRLEWSAFRKSGLLNAKQAVALDLLAAGYANNELAAALGVSAPRATQIKEQLAKAVVEFFGRSVVPPAARRARLIRQVAD